MKGFPGVEYILTGIFILSLVTVVVGAVMAVVTRRIIRSVCGLALCCIGLAGLYYFLHSPFLALMQILIYIGAVCITIVFAVMLAEPDEPSAAEAGGRGALTTALGWLVSAVIFWGVARLALGGPWKAPTDPVADGSLRAMGIALLGTYSLAFEAVSLVLLVAILGALAVARGGRGHHG